MEQDPNVRELLEAETPVISIFGKSWDLHTKRALGITHEENLLLIGGNCRVSKGHGREVVYDAEHFFDGYSSNPGVCAADAAGGNDAGADVLCLCDTNGGTLPQAWPNWSRWSVKRFEGVIGIHAHNDSDVAVANSLMAIDMRKSGSASRPCSSTPT